MACRTLPSRRQEEEPTKDLALKLPPGKPGGHLPSIDETRPIGPGPASRRGSLPGLHPSFSRRNSLAGPLVGRRPSLGPMPPLGSRVSFSGLPLMLPRRMAPSYRLEPAPGEHWEAAGAQRALEAALAAQLKDVCYCGSEAGKLVQALCEQIHTRMRELNLPRYKLVCNVVLGPREGQGVRVVSRALWDAVHDGLASATFTNPSLFAVATVHAVYWE
ncbi:tctex1 domain-containing protein 4 [Mus caroli]|uniref:Tctex1 domain-containing protein 4 n=1 Tax=Mus caroli TaxID=10089 RepID=A0A6P7R4Y3_MUSCR|nr:tctex1 domain-containing protein 4 [Mus caroli]XP_029332726.1 tctex1 domain-containing protein 4 [Mus caroli]